MQRLHAHASLHGTEPSNDHAPTVTAPSYADLHAMLTPKLRAYIEDLARRGGELDGSVWYALGEATGQSRDWLEGYLGWVGQHLPPLTHRDDGDLGGVELHVDDGPSDATAGSEHQGANDDRGANIELILDACREQGVTSPLSQAAILAIVSKESNFAPRSEKSYANTSVAQIRKVFGLGQYTDDEIETAKRDPDQFWEMVYGAGSKKGKDLGNTEVGDGSKYRGRGYNQVTGRAAYKKYGDKFGVDLLANPDLLNTDHVLAAKVLVAMMVTRIGILLRNGRLATDYGATDLNGFADLEHAVYAFYNCNAGTGKSRDDILADPTGGLKRALSNAPGLLSEVEARR